MSELIKIITFIVRGLGNDKKRREVFHYLNIKRYDIILMQELHSVKSLEKYWSNTWGSKIWFSHGTTLTKGTAILFRKGLSYQVHNIITDNLGQFVILYLTLNGKKFIISSVYAPNGDDPLFFTEWVRELTRFSPDYYVLGGDYNLVMEEEIDRIGLLQARDNSRKILQQFIRETDMTEIWRLLNPDKSEFTWRRLHPKPVFSRLDYFLINTPLVQFVRKCEIIPGFQTDHSIVILELDFGYIKRGPGY